jgi:hypothetical protein
MNKGCGAFDTIASYNCSLIAFGFVPMPRPPAKPNCKNFTEVETVSIPASDLAELRAEVAELKKDQEMLDFFDKHEPQLSTNAAGAWSIQISGNDNHFSGWTIREAISRAIKEEG